MCMVLVGWFYGKMESFNSEGVAGAVSESDKRQPKPEIQMDDIGEN